ncbi:hypothetical protein REPUB_Repub16aG0093500 [Reevesia pubescens]
MRVGPEIKKKVKRAAAFVAKEWKLKIGMKGEDEMEILLFLMLVGAYGLLGQFKSKEIRNLFERVAQHKQASLLGRVLGFFATAAPGKISLLLSYYRAASSIPKQTWSNWLSIDDTMINYYSCPSSADLRFITSTPEDRLLMFLNEHGTDGKGDDVYNALKMSEKFEQYIASSSTSCWPELLSLSIGMDARGLILFLSKHVEAHNLMRGDISTALQLAADSAKLVLDALSSFHRSKSGDGFKGAALSNARKSCILLLEQLMTCSVQIERHVNEEALNLAVEWKERMEEKYPQGVGTWILAVYNHIPFEVCL